MGAEDFVKLSIRYRADMQAHDITPDAELTFIRALAWCGLNVTGGAIHRAALGELAPRPKTAEAVAAELVAAGFWKAKGKGWQFAQWDKWQGDFDQVIAKREADAKRKRDKRRAARDEQFAADTAAADTVEALAAVPHPVEYAEEPDGGAGHAA